ncbi:hypothetical protein [Candidatus Nitrosocosmicus hydrocola]|uniref:hypothetical protein n=1 Tax=Candidatus Nitrosocosmicus hydrocola TaxID=1826872 RepID=UPI0011E5EB87|nr:hypothetical protein [Candidatus Nitrosocosmicus hydrocola]
MLASNNTKLTAVLVVAVFAVLMTLGPAASNFQSVFATNGVDSEQCRDDEDYYEDNEEACDKDLRLHFGEDYDGDFGSKSIDDDDDDEDNDNGDGNSANQGIGQSQSSKQNSQVVSGENSEGSGNNFSFQNQENSGSNAIAQDGNGNGDGNSANQGIGQSQSSKQNSQVVSGGDTIGSGNNFSFQNQENSGNNAAAQQD